MSKRSHNSKRDASSKSGLELLCKPLSIGKKANYVENPALRDGLVEKRPVARALNQFDMVQVEHVRYDEGNCNQQNCTIGFASEPCDMKT
mmetsp:Transcript_93996/g.166407  ORF Transcript_93996/g.166407 Transcript_93996/m.166407 type:complete len:90 (-) Transcript_93996:725-994(-)